MKMSRDKDDNVVIRFTERYKKNTFKIWVKIKLQNNSEIE
jgi:hypothetical protein